jgi:hypothetical protein
MEATQILSRARGPPAAHPSDAPQPADTQEVQGRPSAPILCHLTVELVLVSYNTL